MIVGNFIQIPLDTTLRIEHRTYSTPKDTPGTLSSAHGSLKDRPVSSWERRKQQQWTSQSHLSSSLQRPTTMSCASILRPSHPNGRGEGGQPREHEGEKKRKYTSGKSLISFRERWLFLVVRCRARIALVRFCVRLRTYNSLAPVYIHVLFGLRESVRGPRTPVGSVGINLAGCPCWDFSLQSQNRLPATTFRNETPCNVKKELRRG